MKKFKFKQNGEEYEISINEGSHVDDRNECEHCGTVDQFDITIFDGGISWCENCADSCDIEIPKALEKEVSEYIQGFAIKEYIGRIENMTGKKVKLV